MRKGSITAKTPESTKYTIGPREGANKWGAATWHATCKKCGDKTIKKTASIKYNADCQKCTRKTRGCAKLPLPEISGSNTIVRVENDNLGRACHKFKCKRCGTKYVRNNTAISKNPNWYHKCLKVRVVKELSKFHQEMAKESARLIAILDQQDHYDYSPRELVTYTLAGLYRAKTRTEKDMKYIEKGVKFCWDDMYQAVEDCGIRPLNTELDRIDNDNYEKGKVRWVDRLTNMRNRAINVYFKSLKTGEIKCQSHWVEYMEISGRLKHQIKHGQHTDLVEVTHAEYIVQELERDGGKPPPFPNGIFFKNGDQDYM